MHKGIKVYCYIIALREQTEMKCKQDMTPIDKEKTEL